MEKAKLALVILDGWGLGDQSESDAVFQANTPCFDQLIRQYPHATLKTYGEHVGLPVGQMGNSEVGHLNIGAGRVVYQDLAKINKAVEDKTLADNSALLDMLKYAEENNKPVHLIGLVSHGGVHSSQEHLHALIDILDPIAQVYVHAFTDGRDTGARDAHKNIAELTEFIAGKRTKLASLIGRFYAMDRDKRWERTKEAYDLLTNGNGIVASDIHKEVQRQYSEGITDEFFKAIRAADDFHPIEEGDAVLCFNFRTDRCRQITDVLTQRDMPEQGMQKMHLHYSTMTRYDESFVGVNVLFEKDNLVKTLGEVVSDEGMSQLRVAETEKYPHVTFFFSGGREQPFEREDRLMVSSPKVATYDLQPEMSAEEVTVGTIQKMQEAAPDFICLNFANPDMVGHTGVYEAIVKAVETTDSCLKRLVDEGLKLGYQFVIIADHGNADKTKHADGKPHTAHTLNPVPVVILSEAVSMAVDGILADIAPTCCELLKLAQPKEMTGASLVRN